MTQAPHGSAAAPLLEVRNLRTYFHTDAGDAFTFAEYDAMFHNAGFARNEMHELAPLPGRVIVSYK